MEWYFILFVVLFAVLFILAAIADERNPNSFTNMAADILDKLLKNETEDYVSFDTAKLLKEKGFDFCCEFQYINCSSGHPFLTDIRDDAGCYYKNTEIEQDAYSAPTLQMAMKWLREVHDIYIMIDKDFATENGWHYVVVRKQDWSDNVDKCLIKQESNRYTYEFACEAAIKYCLENLI